MGTAIWSIIVTLISSLVVIIAADIRDLVWGEGFFGPELDVLWRPPTKDQKMEEPSKVAAFRSWLTQNGGHINPNVIFQQGMIYKSRSCNLCYILTHWLLCVVPSGFNVIAKNDIEKDSSIVSCPFSLAVTPQLAKQALLKVFGQVENLQRWNERQLVCTYISLHWISEDSTYVLFDFPYHISSTWYIIAVCHPNSNMVPTSTYYPIRFSCVHQYTSQLTN